MKKFLSFGLIILLLALGIVVYLYYPRLNLITGFVAKNQCSCVFEANRDPETVASQDNGFDPVDLAEYEIDYENRSASATVFGLKKRTAQFNPGLGCTLLPEGNDKNDLPEVKPQRVQTPVVAPYPYGHERPLDTVFAEVDAAQLETALENAFFEEA